MEKSFYRALEDRFRGSRELVKSRLEVYLPFVRPILQTHGDCVAVDLGCGRGEWLELLKAEGIQAKGVDLDDGMLGACCEAGLSAVKAEAVEYLSKLEDHSALIVTGFHFVEHIPFEALRRMVSEAYRVLEPGGLLILETPNPENIAVGTSRFYFDPTHLHPIPAELLHFLIDFQGFHRTKVLRLQEIASHIDSENVQLMDIIKGSSQDYSVVAQKNAHPKLMRLLDSAFEKHYGLTVDELAARYDMRANTITFQMEELQDQLIKQGAFVAKIEELEKQVQDSRAVDQQLLTEVSTKLQKLQETEIEHIARIDELNGRLMESELRIQQSSAQLSAERERAKKLELDLRLHLGAGTGAVEHSQRPGSRTRTARNLLSSLKSGLVKPTLMAVAKVLVDIFPPLKSRLKRLAVSAGLVEPTVSSSFRKTGKRMIPRLVSDAGFHTVSSDTGVPIRWLQSNATFTAFSPENCTGTLTLKASSVDVARTLEVHTKHGLAVRLAVGTAFEDFAVEVKLSKGMNVVRLHVPDGCAETYGRPSLNSPDGRCMSVAIQSLSLACFEAADAPGYYLSSYARLIYSDLKEAIRTQSH
jgi:O-antigen chain-terminating methyltransferase